MSIKKIEEIYCIIFIFYFAIIELLEDNFKTNKEKYEQIKILKKIEKIGEKFFICSLFLLAIIDVNQNDKKNKKFNNYQSQTQKEDIKALEKVTGKKFSSISKGVYKIG